MRVYHNSAWVSYICYVCNCCLISIVSNQSHLIALKYKDVRESPFLCGNPLLYGIKTKPGARESLYSLRPLTNGTKAVPQKKHAHSISSFHLQLSYSDQKDSLILNSKRCFILTTNCYLKARATPVFPSLGQFNTYRDLRFLSVFQVLCTLKAEEKIPSVGV